MADRNTLQKAIIYHTLCDMHCHPTAAMVYDQVHRAHPTISRSTVYRVLNKMAAEGKILRLDLAGDNSRYDGQISPHGHLLCRACGRIVDVPQTAVNLPGDDFGFLVENCSVLFRGLCPACRRSPGSTPLATP